MLTIDNDMAETQIINCIIIDDEPLATKLIESYINNINYLNLIGKYQSAIKAMTDMDINNVDLIFLDIQMPELNGIDFAKNINPRCKIVFITAFEQYAIESYKVNALDYLLKPVSFQDFKKSAEKALQWFNITRHNGSGTTDNENTTPNDDSDVIFIKSDHKVIQIKYNDIKFIECIKDYVKIYTEQNEFPIVSLITMKNIEQKLPSEQFMRVHRSYIVRKDKIQLISRNKIIFGETEIPISITHRNEVKRYINSR